MVQKMELNSALSVLTGSHDTDEDITTNVLKQWCRNGIEQRKNSWQDGVSGTNCPIQPGRNWTYVFQTKDQVGSFFYFPSINFHKAAGGFGPIRVNNRKVIAVPFPTPEAEFDLLIGDWFYDSYKVTRLEIYLSHNEHRYIFW